MDTSLKTFDPIKLRPVGFVQNTIDKPFLQSGETGIEMTKRMDAVKDQVREIRQMKSTIVINPDLIDILEGIESYSHLVILYWAHEVSEKSRLVTRVHPMGRKEIPLTGLFSTCSPARPNPVLTTVVRLCGKTDNRLEVQGLDAVNGSPVIDIKPYVKEWYPQNDTRIPEWMRQIIDELDHA